MAIVTKGSSATFAIQYVRVVLFRMSDPSPIIGTITCLLRLVYPL